MYRVGKERRLVEVEKGREEERRGGDIMVEIERERRGKRRKGDW